MSYYVKVYENQIGFPEDTTGRRGESREQAMQSMTYVHREVSRIVGNLIDNSTNPDIRYTIDTSKSRVVVVRYEGDIQTVIFVARITQTEPHTKWRVSVNFEGAWKRHIIGEYDDLEQAKKAAYNVMVKLMILLYPEQPQTSCDPDLTLHIHGDKKREVHIAILPPDTIDETEAE